MSAARKQLQYTDHIIVLRRTFAAENQPAQFCGTVNDFLKKENMEAQAFMREGDLIVRAPFKQADAVMYHLRQEFGEEILTTKWSAAYFEDVTT
jgi:hypothetical protein